MGFSGGGSARAVSPLQGATDGGTGNTGALVGFGAGDGSAGGAATLVGGLGGAGQPGGPAYLSGGSADADGAQGAAVTAANATPGVYGRLTFYTDNDNGSGDAVPTSDGAGGVLWRPLVPRIAAGVPSGAPGPGEARIAIDTTAVSGGIYGWNGAAWVKGASI